MVGVSRCSANVALSLEQLRMILEALEHSKRLLAPPLGSPNVKDTKTFNLVLDNVKSAIDIIQRKNAKPS